MRFYIAFVHFAVIGVCTGAECNLSDWDVLAENNKIGNSCLDSEESIAGYAACLSTGLPTLSRSCAICGSPHIYNYKDCADNCSTPSCRHTCGTDMSKGIARCYLLDVLNASVKSSATACNISDWDVVAEDDKVSDSCFDSEERSVTGFADCLSTGLPTLGRSCAVCISASLNTFQDCAENCSTSSCRDACLRDQSKGLGRCYLLDVLNASVKSSSMASAVSIAEFFLVIAAIL